MKCPVCKEVGLLMSERQGVEIDYCPTCRGVWLDRNELDKIIEKSASSSNDYGHHSDRGEIKYDKHKYGDDHKYHQKRKKTSMLGDLFDIF